MVTLWKELGDLGPGWVGLIVTVGFSTVVLIFGYIFESTYYAMFGVEITDYTSRTFFLGSPFRHPVTFGWAVLFAFILIVNIRLLIAAKTDKQSWMQPLFLIVMIYVGYLVVSGDAKEEAETLRRIEVPSTDDGVKTQSLLFVGNIGGSLVVCDPRGGRIKIMETPSVIAFPKTGDKSANAKDCWQSKSK